MYKIIFAVVGAILGIPMSYYFQSDMIQRKFVDIQRYMKHFDKVIESDDLTQNVLISVVVYAIAGGLIGLIIDELEKRKFG